MGARNTREPASRYTVLEAGASNARVSEVDQPESRGVSTPGTRLPKHRLGTGSTDANGRPRTRHARTSLGTAESRPSLGRASRHRSRTSTASKQKQQCLTESSVIRRSAECCIGLNGKGRPIAQGSTSGRSATPTGRSCAGGAVVSATNARCDTVGAARSDRCSGPVALPIFARITRVPAGRRPGQRQKVCGGPMMMLT
jgi:hypothetical protein